MLPMLLIGLSWPRSVLCQLQPQLWPKAQATTRWECCSVLPKHPESVVVPCQRWERAAGGEEVVVEEEMKANVG